MNIRQDSLLTSKYSFIHRYVPNPNEIICVTLDGGSFSLKWKLYINREYPLLNNISFELAVAQSYISLLYIPLLYTSTIYPLESMVIPKHTPSTSSFFIIISFLLLPFASYFVIS